MSEAVSDHTTLLHQIERMDIATEVLSIAEIRQRAIDLHDEWASEPVGLNAPQDVIDPIVCRYVRFYLTRYDKALEREAERTADIDAIRLIRQRIYESVAHSYPHLAAECAKQVPAA
jgi:hypothetical protein